MARGNNRNRGGLYYDDNFYDPAALIARNRNDDEWYNLGYLLGTAWGANYNQRGTEKATQEGMKILDEAQAKMKQQESTASQNEKAFNAMINDQDNVMGAYKMPSSYAEANGYINELTEQGGEYANVAPKTKGYTDYLQETPKQTLADADFSFRADEAAPKLIAQMRADGRNDYQINAAMKALEPRLLAMDKEAKRGTVQQLAEGLFNEAGYIDMSNPNNVLNLSKILDLDPTYGALLGKMAMTRQDKELKDLQIANARQKLTGKTGKDKSIFDTKMYESVSNQIGQLNEQLEMMDSQDPRYQETVKELEQLQGIKATMEMSEGIVTDANINRADKRNKSILSAAEVNPNDYASSQSYIQEKYKQAKEKNQSTQQFVSEMQRYIKNNDLADSEFAKAFATMFAQEKDKPNNEQTMAKEINKRKTMQEFLHPKRNTLEENVEELNDWWNKNILKRG